MSQEEIDKQAALDDEQGKSPDVELKAIQDQLQKEEADLKKANDPDGSEDESAGKTPTDKPDASKPDDSTEQTSLDELRTKLNESEKGYGELRKTFTQRQQEMSEIRKHNETLQSSVNDMISEFSKLNRKKNFDPAKFKAGMETQPQETLDEFITGPMNELRAEVRKNREEDNQHRQVLEYTVEFQSRCLNTTKYPNFQELEGTMNKIASDPNCPIDRNLSMAARLDGLYNLATKADSSKAVENALAEGERKAEEKLAKEAKTHVAGSGKSGGAGTAFDPLTMPLDQLEKAIGTKRRDGYEQYT